MSTRAEQLRLLWLTAVDQHQENLAAHAHAHGDSVTEHMRAVHEDRVHPGCLHCQRIADTRADVGEAQAPGEGG
jgi:hypothetical protein